MREQTIRIFSAILLSLMLVLGIGSVSFASGGGSDATLGTLEVSPGTLSPEFSPNVYDYEVEVASDVDKLLVNAKPTDSGAKMVIAGNSGLKVGSNSVLINVTAADGNTVARYTIHVTRAAEGSVTATTGAETGEATEPNSEAVENTDGDLATEGGETTAEPAETDSATAASAGVIQANAKTITLSDPDDSVIPQGFNSVDLEINGQTVKAWKFPSSMNADVYFLLYGTDESGNTGFFVYDETTGSAITAPEAVLSMYQETQLTLNQFKTEETNYINRLKNRMYIIIGLVVLCFILLIALTASATRRRKSDEETELPVRDDGVREHRAYRVERSNGPEEETYFDDEDSFEEETYEDEPYTGETYEDEPYTGETYEDEPYTGETYEDEPNVEETYEEEPYVEETYEEEPYVEETYEDVPYTEETQEEKPYAEESDENEQPFEGADAVASTEDEEDDLDSDFEFLEALLSDSVREMGPESDNSIVERAAKKTGRSIVRKATSMESKALEDDDDFELFDL